MSLRSDSRAFFSRLYSFIWRKMASFWYVYRVAISGAFDGDRPEGIEYTCRGGQGERTSMSSFQGRSES